MQYPNGGWIPDFRLVLYGESLLCFMGCQTGALFVVLSDAPNLKMLGLLQVHNLVIYLSKIVRGSRPHIGYF